MSWICESHPIVDSLVLSHFRLDVDQLQVTILEIVLFPDELLMLVEELPMFFFNLDSVIFVLHMNYTIFDLIRWDPVLRLRTRATNTLHCSRTTRL
jgi:hypothetical protein